MIRIQIICFDCKQMVDSTVYARKGTAIAAAFEGLHTKEECHKEVPLDGQDQEGSGGGATSGDGDAEGKPAAAAPTAEPVDPRKVH